jgi:succinoglycan biosynthesis transport protein ExoP
MAYTIDEIDGTSASPRHPRRASDGGGVGLREIIDTLRRRWRIVAITTTIVMALAALFILVSPTLYTAVTQLLMDPRDRRILGTEVMATSAGADPTLVESQLRIITSDAVLGRVVARLKLDADPEFVSTTAKESADVRKARAVIALRRSVTVSRAERTYVIDVSARARKPERAKEIADAIANAYLDDQAEANRAMTRRATDSLTSRLAQLRSSLRAAEDRSIAYRRAHGLVLTQGALLSEQQLGDLNRRLVQARVRAEDAQARYDEIKNSGGSGGVSEVLGSSVVTSLRAQLSEITRKEAELSSSLGNRHPALVEVRAQLANTRRLIAQESGRIAESAASELAVARANEASISREFNELTGQSQSDTASLVELRDLERDVDAARKLYEAFLNRAKQTAEQEQIATAGARILAPAAIPLNASYPPALLVLLLGLFVGTGVGSTIALASEQMEDTVRSPEELRALSRVDVFSALDEPHRWRGGGLPRNAIAVRALRNALRVEGERSVMVLSTKDNDGGAATALDLAMAASVGGERVLLVDLDMHGRALSKLAGPASKRGIYEVIHNKMPLREAVHVDTKSSLALLTVSNSSIGLNKPVTRDQLAALLEAAKTEFEFIVLSGAALLDDPDIVALGAMVDNVVLVAQAGVTRRDDVITATRLLVPVQRKVRGVVLTAGSGDASTRTG